MSNHVYIVPADIAEAWLDLYEKEFVITRHEINAMLDSLRKQRRTPVGKNTQPGDLIENNSGSRFVFVGLDPDDPEHCYFKHLEIKDGYAARGKCSHYFVVESYPSH